MGSFIYVVTYTGIARNVSADALATSLGGIPRDTDFEATLGLVALTDTTVSFSNLYARRSISYTSGPNALAPDDKLGDFLTNIYTSKFSQLLRSPVIPTPVVFVPTPEAPLLWVNAQYGFSASGQDWADMSGNSNALIQTNLANVPRFDVNGAAENVNTVDFLLSTPTFMQSAAPLAFDEFTYLLTVRSTEAVPTPGLLFERSIDSTAHDGERLFQSQGAPSHSIAVRRNGTTSTGDDGTDWAIDGNWHMVAFTYSHANGGALFLDAAQIATLAALTPEAVVATLYVGARSTGALPVTGQYREAFVFPRELTQVELETMAAYMNPQVGL